MQVTIDENLQSEIAAAAEKNGVDVSTIVKAALRMVVKSFSPEQYEKLFPVPQIEEKFPEVVTFKVNEANDGKKIEDVTDAMIVSAVSRHPNKESAARELGVALKTVYNKYPRALRRIVEQQNRRVGE